MGYYGTGLYENDTMANFKDDFDNRINGGSTTEEALDALWEKAKSASIDDITIVAEETKNSPEFQEWFRKLQEQEQFNLTLFSADVKMKNGLPIEEELEAIRKYVDSGQEIDGWEREHKEGRAAVLERFIGKMKAYQNK